MKYKKLTEILQKYILEEFEEKGISERAQEVLDAVIAQEKNFCQRMSKGKRDEYLKLSEKIDNYQLIYEDELLEFAITTLLEIFGD